MKKPSMRFTAKPTVVPHESPVEPPRVCAQQSITIPPEVGAKHGQILGVKTKCADLVIQAALWMWFPGSSRSFPV